MYLLLRGLHTFKKKIKNKNDVKGYVFTFSLQTESEQAYFCVIPPLL